MQDEELTGKTTAFDPDVAQEEGNDRIPLSRRMLLLAIIFIPIMVIIVEYGEIIRLVDLVSTSLMLIVTFFLLLLIGFNAVLARWAPRWRFSRGELLFFFIMFTAAGNIAGTGMVQMIVPMLTYVHHFATPENKWGQFIPLIKDWMVPDKDVIEGFWRGQTTFYTAEHIQGWLGTIAIWGFFVFAFVAFTLFLNVLLRRQWIERERLAFPIVYFPLELTKQGAGSLLRQKLLWLGFLVPVVLEGLAGLNYLYPNIPYLPIKAFEPGLSLARYFGEFQSGSGGSADHFALITLAFYPLAIGIGYFVQLDVLFSLWFFYWFARFEELVCIFLGFREPGMGSKMYELPYLNQQSQGAFMALAIVSLWLARRHLLAIAIAAFKGGKEGRTRDFISYRIAFFGCLLSGAFIFLFWYLTGVSLIILILFFAIYFLTVIGYTRIRAEAGLCLLYTSPSPRDRTRSRMPSSA